MTDQSTPDDGAPKLRGILHPLPDVTRIEVEHYIKSLQNAQQRVNDFVTLALRALFLANGAALVSVLTYLANARTPPVDVSDVNNAAASFIAGFSAAMVATIFACLSSYSALFSEKSFWHLTNQILNGEPLTDAQKKGAPKLVRHGSFSFLLDGAVIGFLVGSATLFPVGCILMLKGIVG